MRAAADSAGIGKAFAVQVLYCRDRHPYNNMTGRHTGRTRLFDAA